MGILMSYITEHNLQKMHASAFFMSANTFIRYVLLIFNSNTGRLKVSDARCIAAVEVVA